MAAPQPGHSIVDQPATPAACNADYRPAAHPPQLDHPPPDQLIKETHV